MARILNMPKTERPTFETLSIAQTTADYLESQSDEVLIRLGCEALGSIDRAKKFIELLTVIIDGRFDKQAVSELLSCEAGFAERKVTNEWSLIPEKIDALRDYMGREFSLNITEQETVQAVPKLIPELRRMLGKNYEQYFKVESGHKLETAFINAIRDPKSASAEPKVIKDYRKYIKIVSKVKITFKPVNRPMKEA